MGWERSRLGYPTSGERPGPNNHGRISLFEGGAILWTPEGGAVVQQRID